MGSEKELLRIAQRIRALAQTGLVYSEIEYDIERYNELVSLSDKMTSLLTGLSQVEIQSSYQPATDYVTPKVDIRAVVFNEKDEILLVRESADGRWSLPGGWADVGHSPSEVAVKETKEETGLDVMEVRPLAIMDKSRHNHPPAPHYAYKIFILCKIEGGSFDTAFDILDRGFFAQNALPPLSEDRVLKSQIDLMYDLRNNPGRGVYLD